MLIMSCGCCGVHSMTFAFPMFGSNGGGKGVDVTDPELT